MRFSVERCCLEARLVRFLEFILGEIDSQSIRSMFKNFQEREK